MLKRQYIYYAAIAVIGITLLFYFVNQERNKVPYALGVDAIKDTTDIAGTYYRIRVTNIGTNMATNISVYLGQNDIQHFKSLSPDQSWFFYPRPDTDISKVNVMADNGINISTDYRSPLKGIGLPGSGR
ncbi:MAG TPA: hypothetical protein VK462_06325 [Nitrososphaeraceae archaeon]|jgi:hypothetical protein|nr:hypothetical protein [Nitrososphaeraceae archaeon]